MKAALVTLAFGFIFVTLSGQSYGASPPLQVGFYKGKCNGTTDVEEIVKGVVKTWFFKDPTIPPALLRLQFHDCFFNGCDASLLLDGDNTTEKFAPPNLSVRGYDLIDAAKAAVEAICPGVVSCADIIIMATRDAVSMVGGSYTVETGRRDGTVLPLAKSVILPPPSISVSDCIKAFAKKGFNTEDMVYLLGGHTVGVAHCSLFQDRLYNFQKSGQPDNTMSQSLLFFLRLKCPQNATIDNTADLDQNPFSSSIVDNSYYRQILLNRGVLQIDQELALDPSTKDIVTKIANGYDFSTKFGQAMVKLGGFGVLTGTDGQIRRSCRAVNTK